MALLDKTKGEYSNTSYTAWAQPVGRNRIRVYKGLHVRFRIM
jgi:hypothetical protein